jgi:hypothetical protein
MVSDVPRQKLCEIVARFGKSVTDDPRRCEGLLRDYCGSYRRQIHALVSALREKTVEELLSASDGLPDGILAARLARRLEDFRGLDKELAYWAVVSWGLALGRFSREVDKKPNVEDEAKEKEQERLRLQQQEAERQRNELKRIEEERRRLAEEARRDEENRRKLEEERKKSDPVETKFPWKIVSAAAALVALVTLGSLWYFSSPRSIEVESVKFFGDRNGLAADISPSTGPRTNYKTDFRSNEAQYIYYDLRLNKPAPTDAIVEVLWRHPDGTTATQDIGIKTGTYGKRYGRGFVQGSPNWKVGRYVIEFSSSGKKIATAEFNVSPAPLPPPPPWPPPQPPRAQVYDIPQLQMNVLGPLRFFEGPKQAPPIGSRFYQTRFDARAARFLRCEVTLKNAGGLPSQKFKIMTVWYRDNREVHRGDYEASTPEPQRDGPYSYYLGRDLPGYWHPGNYRVEVFIASRLVRAGRFVVQ